MSKNIENTLDLTSELNSAYLIKNDLLRESIEFTLNKSGINVEDLTKIEEIVLNTVTISGKQNNVYFEDIKLFPNLKKIEIANNVITCEKIEYLKNIDEIIFRNCKINSVENIKAKNISFIGCDINCKLEFNDLNEISIINTNCDLLDFLKTQNNLEKLVIKNVKDFTMDKVNFYMPIKYLSIEDIDKINYEVLSNYTKLSTISIDGIDSNKNYSEDVKKLKNMGYKVMFNDMYEV